MGQARGKHEPAGHFEQVSTCAIHSHPDWESSLEVADADVDDQTEDSGFPEGLSSHPPEQRLMALEQCVFNSHAKQRFTNTMEMKRMQEQTTILIDKHNCSGVTHNPEGSLERQIPTTAGNGHGNLTADLAASAPT